MCRGERRERGPRPDLRTGKPTQGAVPLGRQSCFRLAGKGADNEKHYFWPSPGQEETTGGNSESSVRLRSWSLRTGAGKPRRGQEVGSWQDLWASRACWGQEIHCPWALSHHRERGRRDWEVGKGKN